MFSTTTATAVRSPKWTRNHTGSYQFSDHAPDDWWLWWTSTHLPDRVGFFITDLDTVVRDDCNNFMYLEIKKKGRACPPHQINTFALIHQTTIDGLRANNNRPTIKGKAWPVTYHGFHCLTFENTNFQDGRVYWDNVETTEAEVIRRLSFQDPSLIVSKP